MRGFRRAAVILGAVAMGGAVFATPASGVAVPTPESGPWSGYSTGSAIHINALQVAAGGPIVEDTALAFAGASVNSEGQRQAIVNEMNLGVQPANAAREAYGRGSGVEVGVAQTAPNVPDANQVVLGQGIAQAGATPVEPTTNPAPIAAGVQSGLVTRELISQTINPAAYAAVLRGQAQATWNERYVMPMIGSPLGFGLGFADDVQLLNLGAAPPAGQPLPAPVVATDTSAAIGGTGPERTTSQSFSVTYLVNNGDGTCGLASESHVTMAPVRLNVPPDTNAANDLTIEILGEWVLKASVTGKPGGGKVEYMPTGAAASPTTPIVRIIQNNAITQQLTTQQLFGAPGLVLPDALAPVISAAAGEDPRAIAAPGTNPNAASQPTITDTLVSAAVDVARVRLVQPSAPNAGLNALDFRLGHMESRVEVPAGGINCEIPVAKTVTPNPATAGEDLVFTISIPTDADVLRPFPCELTNIRVVDTVEVESGDPRFTVVGGTGPAGQVGVVSGNTITFENIGNYKVGDPPLLVTVVVRLAPDSREGRLKDTVKVDATPANCRASNDTVGRVLGGARFFGTGGARLTGAGLEGLGAGTGGLTGTGTLSGPDIVQGTLPRTGPANTTPILLAIAAGAGGLLLRQLHRRRTA